MLTKHAAVGMFSGGRVRPAGSEAPGAGAGSSCGRSARILGAEGPEGEGRFEQGLGAAGMTGLG